MLTAKYRLHFAQGKDHVNEERLRPYDKARYRIYKALKAEVQNAQSWNELKDALAEYGIDMRFKVSRTTRDIQGGEVRIWEIYLSRFKNQSGVQLSGH